jgi:hypothetical protein
VIWIPEGTTSMSTQQREFIRALHASEELQFGADLVTADVETLKSAVHAMLAKLEAPAPPPAPAAAGIAPRLVYLICDERDRSDTIPLRKLLKSQGFEVNIPLFEGAATSIRQANDDLLGRCDAALVFYGAGDEAWKRTVETDLRRAAATRGTGRPLPPVFTYLAGAATPAKQDLIELEEPNLIDGLAGFDESRLAPFVASLGGGAR